ncbi:MAG: hypothetical protein HY695_24645 [Deltaproteobacteria bacterium]|nr:hypothetical protein [Deltaproteobacteria bacterium]
MKKIRLFVIAGVILGTLSLPGWAAPVPVEVTVQTITGHRDRFDMPGVDAEQSYILIDVTKVDLNEDGIGDINPVAILLLFTGGRGKLEVKDSQLDIETQNFLVRSRNHFAAEGFVVGVIDAASDFLDLPGGLSGHRAPGKPHSGEHLTDIEAVMADLRGKFPNLPLWAAGTSQGTISSARAAAEPHPASRANGLVLTAPLTGPAGGGDLGDVALESIAAPTLVATHREDKCPLTLAEDAAALKKRLTASSRVQVLFFKGGSTPLTDPCDPLAPHGFFGIEQKVIDAVTKWIKHAEK